MSACQHAIQKAAERIQVRARIGRDAGQSLRGQRAGAATDSLRAEVGQFDAAVFNHQHIGGLQVAVKDTPAMGGGQRRTDILAKLQHGCRSRFSHREQFLQIVARDVLHHQCHGLGQLDHIVELHNQWVVECRQRARLRQPGPALLGIVGQRSQFDRDPAAQSAVLRRIDTALPTGLDKPQQAIGPDIGQWHQRRPASRSSARQRRFSAVSDTWRRRAACCRSPLQS